MKMSKNENEVKKEKAIAEYNKNLKLSNAKIGYVPTKGRKTIGLAKEKTVYDYDSERWMSVAEYHTRVLERQNLEIKKLANNVI